MKNKFIILLCLIFSQIYGQFNFYYNFNSTGNRVCLISASIQENPIQIIINLHDSALNTTQNYTIKRRPINGLNSDWITHASNIPPSTSTWIDTNVSLGDAFEYQVSRNSGTDIATGYVTACIKHDQTDYKGRMILVIDNSFQSSLSNEILQLKRDLTYEGWFVEELYVPRATTWETEASILTVKNAITTLYNNAPATDKPKHLFLLGHIPIARSGLNAISPDDHDSGKGARGADCYYADIDGVFTDNQTFNPGNIDVNAINLPNDFKWDQDYIPSQLEMAFGRVDFADISYTSLTEIQLISNYLNRLHNYRTVTDGFDMGNKTAFRFGYNNSNDGSYRSLIPISGINNVDEYSGNLPFPQWVQQNGPYQIFMQNQTTPNATEWETYGMNATIYSSDQSYWGFWDGAQNNDRQGFIRYLLSKSTKCLGLLWTTTGINIFHQPGMGETMGWSCKRIMDHNLSNNLYSKPSQIYDTPDYWGRTHFQYNGDPTLRLNQVIPPNNVLQTFSSGEHLTWNASTDSDIIGYHIYKAFTEFGPFIRLTSTPITSLNYIDPDFTNVPKFYLVKAVKLQITGSGSYLNPSIGVLAVSNLAVSTTEKNIFNIYPNPSNSIITISTPNEIIEKTIYNLQGKLIKSIQNNSKEIDIKDLSDGIYLLKITTENGIINTQKLIKN